MLMILFLVGVNILFNESVQNIRLLSGNAPEAFLELLSYDCRLFNTALKEQNPLVLRDWLVKSDVGLNVQALMLDPQVILDIARSMLEYNDTYSQTIAAVQTAIQTIETAETDGIIHLISSEKNWLDRLKRELETIPDTKDDAVQYLLDTYGDYFLLESYDL